MPEFTQMYQFKRVKNSKSLCHSRKHLILIYFELYETGEGNSSQSETAPSFLKNTVGYRK